MYMELWESECNIGTLGIHICKTTYPINMKFIEVMKQVIERWNTKIQSILKIDKIIVNLIT